MLWFALILSELPLQVFTRGVDDPGQLAVVEAHPRARVVAATAAARARGVAAGAPLAGALAVAPELRLLTRDPVLEAATLAELAAWAGQFTPCVSLDPPHTLALEVSASLRLFGGPEALARRISARLPELGLTATLAAAPTPLAARWLAHACPGAVVRSAPGWTRRLDDLPIALLAEGGVSAATLELLRGIGVRRLADAARLPRDGLARREAGAVSEALARARGERPDPRPWFVPPERYAARLALPAPVATTEPLLFATRRLLAGLVAWLAARHAGLDRCRLHLEHEDQPETVLEVVTGKPGRDEARLALLAREHLAALVLPAPVEALRLTADAPAALAPASGDLFGDPGRDRDSATLLLERLRARLGAQAVRTVHPWPDHRPERAWQPATPGARPRAAPSSPGPRPLWLLPTPRALDSIRGLTLLAGPERIEAGWWDGADVRRDYYVAQAAHAGVWWVFEALDPPGGWYVHGFFG